MQRLAALKEKYAAWDAQAKPGGSGGSLMSRRRRVTSLGHQLYLGGRPLLMCCWIALEHKLIGPYSKAVMMTVPVAVVVAMPFRVRGLRSAVMRDRGVVRP